MGNKTQHHTWVEKYILLLQTQVSISLQKTNKHIIHVQQYFIQ